MNAKTKETDFPSLFQSIDNSIQEVATPDNIHGHIRIILGHMNTHTEEEHVVNGLREKATSLVYALRTAILKETKQVTENRKARAVELRDYLCTSPSPVIDGHDIVIGHLDRWKI